MDMSSKQLKKKIEEYKQEIKLSKEQKKKLKNEIHSKKKNLTQIRTEFYDKLTPNEDDKVYINDNGETLQKIFQLYKSINTMNKQKNSIEFNLEGLKEENSVQIQKNHRLINNIHREINEKEIQIQKINRDIDKFIKNSNINFEIENYVVNPGMEFTNTLAELTLGAQVQKNLKYLLRYTKKQNSSIKEEIDQYKKALSKLKKQKGIEDKSEKEEEEEEEEEEGEESNEEKDEEKKDNTKDNSNIKEGVLEKIEEEKNEENEASEDHNKEEKTNLPSENNEKEATNEEAKEETSISEGSIVLDSIGLTPRNLERFIESPRFIDKVVSTNKIIQPIKLEIDIDNQIPYASVIKIKHIEKPKETIETLNQQIEASNNTINDLRKELSQISHKNEEMLNKKKKLEENINYNSNKIEIIMDQIKLIQDQMKDKNIISKNLSTNNQEPYAQYSPISINSTNKKSEE